MVKHPEQGSAVDDDWDDLPFRAYIRVTSHRCRLDEIVRALVIEPDYTHDIGDANPYRKGGVYKWSDWEWRLVVSDEISRGAEGFSEAIEALDDDLADRLASLADRGCQIDVMAVQEFVYGEDYDTGIHLTPSAIRWIARARASVDIDQYVWELGRQRSESVGTRE